MRKIYTVILILLVLMFSLIFLLPNDESNGYYIIKQSYGFVYNESKQADIDIYTKLKKSTIQDTSSNEYYMHIDNTKTRLNNVNVTKSKTGQYYVYTLSFDLPIFSKNIRSNDVSISIVGDDIITINLNHISIIYEEYEEASYSSVYATYGYIDGMLMLVGINIEFDDEYNEISYFSVNEFAYSDFSNIIFSTNFNNEISIKDNLPNYRYDIINVFNTPLKSNKLFIPVTYNDLVLIKHGYISLILDNKHYIINDFDYIFNNLDINDYPKYIEELLYA